MPTFRAGLGLALFLLVSFSGIIALAAEDHAFFADEIAAFIGQPLPAGYKAEMADISSTFSFKQPTSVFAGELVVKLEGAETADADVIVFLRGGKIVGVELTYVPDDSTELGALPFDEQLARYDYLYAHITNNYSGSDLGESLIYDDSGGLYEWRDGNVWWGPVLDAGRQPQPELRQPGLQGRALPGPDGPHRQQPDRPGLR